MYYTHPMVVQPSGVFPLISSGQIRRINVIGTSGSGKSTLSKALAERLNVPYVEMDKIFWEPNWKQKEDDRFFSDLEQAISLPCWVLDGNYTRTIPIKWNEVDLVIWLDYSFPRTFYQALARAIHRAYTKVELWENTGNRESFRKSFFHKDSIIWWTIKTHSKVRARTHRILKDPKFQNIRFLRLSSPKEASVFLEKIPCANTSSFAR